MQRIRDVPVHRLLLAVVGLLTAVTATAMVVLWPRTRPTASRPLPPQFHGTVREADTYPCPPVRRALPVGHSGPCQMVSVEILDGPEAGTSFELDTARITYPPFSRGDRVLVAADEGGSSRFYVTDFDRRRPLALLAGVFVAVVSLVGRRSGFRALLGLAVSLVVVTQFIVPAVVAGKNPFGVAVVGAFAVMIVTLYVCHGLNLKTTSAVVGTAAALATTALLGLLFVDLTKITGFSSEEATFVRSAVQGLDVRGLVLAGLIIGALGVLDDITIGQASTVFTVHDANPEQSWREIFHRAMRVGRDHIAATVNTLVFAYVGASVALIVLFSVGGIAVGDAINSEVVAEAIVTTLVGSVGLILAVPLTTALSALVVARQTSPAPPIPAHLRSDVDESTLSVEELDHRRWVRFLRETAGQSRRGSPEVPQQLREGGLHDEDG